MKKKNKRSPEEEEVNYLESKIATAYMKDETSKLRRDQISRLKLKDGGPHRDRINVKKKVLEVRN